MSDYPDPNLHQPSVYNMYTSKYQLLLTGCKMKRKEQLYSFAALLNKLFNALENVSPSPLGG